mgnify:CR=1 FL=1
MEKKRFLINKKIQRMSWKFFHSTCRHLKTTPSLLAGVCYNENKEQKDSKNTEVFLEKKYWRILYDYKQKKQLNMVYPFPNTYVDAPFRDPNWQLIRVKESEKSTFYGYMQKDGFVQLNVKVEPEWRDFWREVYPSVIPGYHQK